MRILIGIPVYNCEKQISRLLNKLGQRSDDFTEAIIVNNFSTDNTSQAVKDFLLKQKHKNINLLNHQQNYGLGGSFKTIVQYAKDNSFDYLVLLHGDDQVDIKDLDRILETIDDQDVLWGSRFMPQSILSNYSLKREWANKILNFFASIILGKRIYELGSGLNAFRVQSLPLEDIPKWPNHIAYDMNLLFHFNKSQYKFINFPINWNSFDEVSTVNDFTVAFTVILMLVKYFFGFKDQSEENIVERKYEKIGLNELVRLVSHK
jgi:glycosyltransferase involved in cell wall biosynthesis